MGMVYYLFRNLRLFLTQMNINELYIFFSIEGWNTWYHFWCNISETIVRESTDAIVATGLAAAGYEYGIFTFYSIYANHYLSITVYSKFGWLLARESICSRYYSTWSHSFSKWYSSSSWLCSFKKTQIWSLFRCISQILFTYSSHSNCFFRYNR